MGGRYGLQIRTATLADAPGLSELFAAAGIAATSARLEERLGGWRGGVGTVLIALEWGPPSGVVAATWCPVLLGDGPAAEIALLLVAPEERRRGIGRLLLKAVAQAARSAGCATIRFSTRPGDDGLDAFGAAAGFVENGRVLVRPLRKRG